MIEQLRISQCPSRAILAVPDNRILIPLRAVGVTVQAIERDVRFATDEPGVVWKVMLEHFRPRLEPMVTCRLRAPEGIGVLEGPLILEAEILDGRGGLLRGGRVERPVSFEQGFEFHLHNVTAIGLSGRRQW